MSTLSTHVLDTSLGLPAQDLALTLEQQNPDGNWRELARARTNTDGRVPALLPPGTAMAQGIYRLTFDTAGYFRARKSPGFYPYVQVVFELTSSTDHCHVPLLLSPFGYSTYRGS